MKLQEKVILITGASGGIGLEVARALLQEGAFVALCARSKEKLIEEAKRATDEGLNALAVQMDVTSDESVRAAIQSIIARWGRLDVVINNAGNGGRLSYWNTTDPHATQEMFDVHVFGAERVIRAALPFMLAQQSGTIMNIASTVGWVPMPGAAAYSAAKAAVISLSDTLRAELAPNNIDVRVFAPPHTSTDAGKEWPLGLPKIFAPEWVAAELVSALKGKRSKVIPGGNGMLLFLQRLWPPLATRIMNKIGFTALTKVAQREQ